MTESDIIEFARKGDEKACRRLFERHFPRVFRIALIYVRYNEEDAKDITQESFITAFRKLGSLKDPEKFGQWISTIARNFALNHVNEKKKLREIPLLQDRLIDEYLLTYDEDDGHTKNMELEIIREIINSIPNESVRDTVRMYYLDENLSTEQIAQRQGVRKTVVTSRLHRFRSKYKELIVSRILELRGDI